MTIMTLYLWGINIVVIGVRWWIGVSSWESVTTPIPHLSSFQAFGCPPPTATHTLTSKITPMGLTWLVSTRSCQQLSHCVTILWSRVDFIMNIIKWRVLQNIKGLLLYVKFVYTWGHIFWNLSVKLGYFMIITESESSNT